MLRLFDEKNGRLLQVRLTLRYAAFFSALLWLFHIVNPSLNWLTAVLLDKGWPDPTKHDYALLWQTIRFEPILLLAPIAIQGLVQTPGLDRRNGHKTHGSAEFPLVEVALGNQNTECFYVFHGISSDQSLSVNLDNIGKIS
jgi:hypothetical protein